MSILDENNFDKLITENTFTIDDENYKDEHSIKIKRDDELNIILNQEAIILNKDMNSNFEEFKVLDLMNISDKFEETYTLTNIYTYTRLEQKNKLFTRIDTETDIKSIEWNSNTFKDTEYIIEFIDNIPNNHVWSNKVITNTISQTDIEIGDIKIEYKNQMPSLKSYLNLEIDGQEIYLSKNKKEQGCKYTNGTILYKGNPTKELRDKIRNILSFFIGRVLILLEETFYDNNWNITSFKAFSPHNTMNNRAFKINTILPMPLNNDFDNLIKASVLSEYVTLFLRNYDLCDFNHISWLYWHSQCSALHTKCGELGATIEALQKAYIENNKIGWSNAILDKSDFREFKKDSIKIIDKLNISEKNKEILKDKFHKFNQLPQKITLKKLFEDLDISLVDLELKAWQGRNDSAHGGKMKDYSIEKLQKQTDLIQGIFYKLILTISVNAYEYYDYYSDSIGVRSNRKIQLKEINEFNLSSNSRENWQENIKEVLEKNKDKKDEGIIFELLDDSDLKDF